MLHQGCAFRENSSRDLEKATFGLGETKSWEFSVPGTEMVGLPVDAFFDDGDVFFDNVLAEKGHPNQVKDKNTQTREGLARVQTALDNCFYQWKTRCAQSLR